MKLLGNGGKSTRDTNRTGNISEAAIITRLLELGYAILTPYGGNQRVDLIVEDVDGHFWRVQCKSAHINADSTVIRFHTANHNVTGENRQIRNYRGQCDYFAAYCQKLDKTYLIRVDEAPGMVINLRLLPTKNKQEKNVRWAKDYEL